MSDRHLIDLIDRLRALPVETEWFEFKRNRYEPQVLGERVGWAKHSVPIVDVRQLRRTWNPAPNPNVRPHSDHPGEAAG